VCSIVDGGRSADCCLKILYSTTIFTFRPSQFFLLEIINILRAHNIIYYRGLCDDGRVF